MIANYILNREYLWSYLSSSITCKIDILSLLLFVIAITRSIVASTIFYNYIIHLLTKYIWHCLGAFLLLLSYYYTHYNRDLINCKLTTFLSVIGIVSIVAIITWIRLTVSPLFSEQQWTICNWHIGSTDCSNYREASFHTRVYREVQVEREKSIAQDAALGLN